MKIKLILKLLLGCILCGLTSVASAISVGPAGYTNDFSSIPTVLEGWSTTNILGGAGDLVTAAQLDAELQKVAATNVTGALPTDSALPVSANSLFRWNSVGSFIESRAVNAKLTLLMATLKNSTGTDVSSFKVSYYFGELAGNSAESVPGMRVFYSLTGATNSWQAVPALSTGVTGALTATLSIGTWPAGNVMYLLWGDDNASGNEGSYTIDNFSITAVITNAQVSITAQPVDQFREAGHPAVFTVGLSGLPPYYYAWYFGTNPIAGANGPTYTIPSPTTADAGQYHVVVSNSYSSATSDSALLTVTNYPVVITNQPKNTIVATGSPTNFTVGVSGTPPIFYQWFHGASPIANATNQSHTVINAQSPDAGIYSVMVSNLNNTVTSSNALLTVTNFPVVISSQPQSTTTLVGMPASFTVGLNGTPPFFYKWFHGSSPIANGTNQTLALSSVQPADAGIYTVMVSNLNNTVTSSNAYLSVSFLPYTVLEYSNVWKYNQSNMDLGTAWKEVAYDDSSWPSGPGLLAVENAALPDTIRTPLLLTFPGSGTQTPTYYFRTQVVLTSPPSALTLTATNLIDDGAVFYVNGVEVYRIGMAAGPVNFTDFSNRSVGDSVAEYVNLPTDLWVKGTNVLAVEVHQRTETSSDVVFGMQITVTIQPVTILSISSQPASVTVGETSPATFHVGVSGGSGVFQWFKDGTPINGAVAATYTIPVSTFTDAGNYSVMVSNEVNVLFSSNATLVVTNFPIAITSQPQSRTNLTDVVTTIFTVGVIGATPRFFTWFKENSPISGATNQTLQISMPGSNDIGHYFVVVSNLAGSVTSSVATLTIPPPTITVQPLSVTVSAGQGAGFSVTAVGSWMSYQWRKEGVNIADATNSFLAFGKVQTNQAGAYSVVISNISGSLTSSVAVLAVNQTFPGMVVAWGDNSSGQTNVPAGLSGVTAVAAGFYHTVALRTNGTVVAWGSNSDGQTSIPAGLSGVVAIAAGDVYTVAVKDDGTVTAWGNNGSGQLNIPVGLSGVTEVAAGRGHTVALKNDGTVVAWGRNEHGQATVPAGLSGVIAIAAGDVHTMALKNDGKVLAWGFNQYGEAVVPAGLSGVTAISAGGYHNVVLKNNGTVVAWGRNDFGQANVPASLSGVTSVAGGNMHSLVRKSDGTLVAWGSNGSGESTIPAGLSRVIAIAAGSLFSVALTNTPPVITSQPQSQVVRVGTNVSFSVTATGTGTMTYQWRKNGIAIANATNSTITFQAANRSFAGSYSAVVSIPTGVIVSSNALLRVLVAQRMERAEMLPGGTFKFRFGDGDGGVLTEADKNGFTLQWSTDLVQWFDLTNATCTVVNGMLELADPAAATQARRFYRVMEQ